MKIYTKTGDKGQTGIIGGKRVAKDHDIIEALGILDELNASLGLLHNDINKSVLKKVLRIQKELLIAGTEIASFCDKGKIYDVRLGNKSVEMLEEEIDKWEEKLKPLKNFIIPGGKTSSAKLMWIRTVCRKFERQLVRLCPNYNIDLILLKYFNRLSDWLFIAGRVENELEN